MSIDIYECSICQEKFSSVAALGGHSKQHSTRPLRCCSILTKQEVEVGSLNRHEQAWIRKKTIATHVCKHCQNPFRPKDGKSKSKFCRRSCSAKETNKLRRKHPIRMNKTNILKSKAVVGEYCKIFYGSCVECHTDFVSDTTRTICSDECWIKNRQRCSKGIKRKIYNGQTFDSQWEVEIAMYLDSSGIKWVKRHCIPYFDHNGKRRRYYPDFFLPDHNVYLDPKNPYVIILQAEKLSIVTKQINLVYGNVTKLKSCIDRLR